MPPAVTQPPAAPLDDPVWMALVNLELRDRLLDHARSMLGCQLADRPSAVRLEAATEVVQETQLRALQNRHDFDPAAGSVRAWLHGIINNVLFETARSYRDLPVQAVAPPSAWEPLAADAVLDRLAATDYLSRLPAEHQQVLRLRFYEDLSHLEIAARLEITPANARVRLCRALAAAKEIAGAGPKGDQS